MLRRMFFLKFPQGVEYCTCGQALTLKRGNRSDARVQQQLEKCFVRNKKLQKKFYDSDNKGLLEYSKPLEPHKKSMTRKLNPGVMLRERNVCNLLKIEIQNLIDSGELGEEVRVLNLTLTKASMNSVNVCQVFWEPFCSAKDLDVSETLNSLSGKLRHMLIVNHIMNNVPTIHFYMDPASRRAALVEKIFAEEYLDIGDDDETEFRDEVKDCEAGDFQQSRLLGFDHDEMFSKLKILKQMNKVDRS